MFEFMKKNSKPRLFGTINSRCYRLLKWHNSQISKIGLFNVSSKRRRQDESRTATRCLCIIAVLALLLLIGSLIGLGFTLRWYLRDFKPKDELLVDKIKVYIHRNRTSNRKSDGSTTQVTGIYKHKTGWTSTALTTALTTVSTTTTNQIPRIRVTNAQLKALYDGSYSSTLPTSTSGLPDRRQVVTIVTCLLDIGREKWPTYSRPISKYHDYMRNLLRMRVPMVIFTDMKSLNFVQEVRDSLGLLPHTKIWNISLSDLPLYKHHHLFHSIIHHELNENGGWKAEWNKAMKLHPEARSADYDLLVNSKPYFLYNASRDDPFNTEHFAWIDAGYGGGDVSHFPGDFQWYPIFPKNMISVIKLTPSYDKLSRYTAKVLYRQDEAVISGGFLGGGDRRAVSRFYSAFHWKVVEMLFRRQMVDDDQTTLVFVINEHSYLFNIAHGDWYDAFRLF
ncbi:hypothetical protein M3Y96_00961300 [Aphelenchoides besseyi]|nr:hypothetical protein M3Y96_00961300 [Aphelenchoides besseyi]